MKLQVIRRHNLYAVRARRFFIWFLWAHDLNGTHLWDGGWPTSGWQFRDTRHCWVSEEQAKILYNKLISKAASLIDIKAMRKAKIEVVNSMTIKNVRILT